MVKDMSNSTKRGQILREAIHLQAMENNPLDAEDIAMFEMFEREGWSPAKRHAYILEQIEDERRWQRYIAGGEVIPFGIVRDKLRKLTVEACKSEFSCK